MRGQTVICIILAVLYAAVLRSVGLHHAISIGLLAGLISFVPYLGAGAGFVVSMCVAVAQFWPNWTPIAVVGGTFLIGEMLADYVLAPRIIGRRVKLNPVWLMFALFAFGSLFGFSACSSRFRSRPRSAYCCVLRSESSEADRQFDCS